MASKLTKDGAAAEYYRTTVLAHDGLDCLFWPYGKMGMGYGVLWVVDRSKLVHRMVCEYFNGPAPDGTEAAHSCGNGRLACVAHRHLSWKTHIGNEADKLIHGTRARGTRHARAKLTDDDVRYIRSLPSAPISDLALRYGVDRSTIRQAISGRTWSWLDA